MRNAVMWMIIARGIFGVLMIWIAIRLVGVAMRDRAVLYASGLNGMYAIVLNSQVFIGKVHIAILLIMTMTVPNGLRNIRYIDSLIAEGFHPAVEIEQLLGRAVYGNTLMTILLGLQILIILRKKYERDSLRLEAEKIIAAREADNAATSA